jgi:hypothetical protein
MTHVRTFYLLTILLITNLSVFGQVDCDTTKYPKLLSNSYQCKWIFINLTDTIEGIIVKHERQITGCGVLATASLTIIKVDNDTIRVIDLCNNKEYSIGQRVKVISETEPKFQVDIPHYILILEQKVKGRKKITKQQKEERIITLEKELYIWYSNEFDEIILRTTWGQIINE